MAAALVACLAGCPAPSGRPPEGTVVVPHAWSDFNVEETASSADRPRAERSAGPIAWETSELEAREKARKSHLPMIIFAYASWDASGMEMQRTTWEDPAVRANARSFVALKLDLTDTDSADAEAYAQRYEVRGVPSTLVFDASGTKVAAMVGFSDAKAVVEAMEKAR